eukprot:ANDGO_02794.mRNA.1 ATP-dependent zinc metalloprotease FtsH
MLSRLWLLDDEHVQSKSLLYPDSRVHAFVKFCSVYMGLDDMELMFGNHVAELPLFCSVHVPVNGSTEVRRVVPIRSTASSSSVLSGLSTSTTPLFTRSSFGSLPASPVTSSPLLPASPSQMTTASKTGFSFSPTSLQESPLRKGSSFRRDAIVKIGLENPSDPLWQWCDSDIAISPVLANQLSRIEKMELRVVDSPVNVNVKWVEAAMVRAAQHYVPRALSVRSDTLVFSFGPHSPPAHFASVVISPSSPRSTDAWGYTDERTVVQLVPSSSLPCADDDSKSSEAYKIDFGIFFNRLLSSVTFRGLEIERPTLVIIESRNSREVVRLLRTCLPFDRSIHLVYPGDILETAQSEEFLLELLARQHGTGDVLVFMQPHLLFPRVLTEETSISVRDRFLYSLKKRREPRDAPVVLVVPDVHALDRVVVEAASDVIEWDWFVLKAQSPVQESNGLDEKLNRFKAAAERYKHTIVGLEHVVASIGNSLFHSVIGISDGLSPFGYLLYGPPGTGKTSVARLLTYCEPSISVFVLRITDVLRGTVGEGEKSVRETFERASIQRPSVVFLDELQAVFGKKSDDRCQPVLAQLFSELDRLSIENASSVNGAVVVLGATNRPDLLDESLLRKGRLDQHVFVSLPAESVRREIFLSIDAVKQSCLSDEMVDAVVRRSSGYSCADVVNIARQAQLFAVGRGLENPVWDDYVRVLSSSVASVSPESLRMLQSWQSHGGTKVRP